MKYAVFDWDNTIRNGYTLFSWIDYLYSIGILSLSVKEKIESIQNEYNAGIITHDQYAKKACLMYAAAMKGFSQAEYGQILEEYLKLDEKNCFPFAQRLFRNLSKNNIKIIIISGAPEYIIDHYRGKFSIHEIYAFCEEFANGICTGKVAHNYGFDKHAIIHELKDKYHEYPVLGVGDAPSDLPLFRYSNKALCVVNNSQVKRIELPNLQYLKIDARSDKIDSLVSDILSGNKN